MKKILIVEDEEMIVKALKQKLESSDLEVEIASDGKQAIDKVAETPPDLILLDLVMPNMDGISFLKILKSKEYKSIPVIILTNLENETSTKEAAKLGVTDYLIKVDYSLDEVVKSIKNKLKN